MEYAFNSEHENRGLEKNISQGNSILSLIDGASQNDEDEARNLGTLCDAGIISRWM